MTGLRWVQLPEAQRDEFLGTGGTGVLSFATGDADEPPVSVPVSYGYFDETEDFYFRLSVPPGSRKPAVLDNPVTFVVAEETDDGWHSVIASGELRELAELPPESGDAQGMWAVRIPAVDVFDRPRDEVEFRDFQLDPTSITGRKEVT